PVDLGQPGPGCVGDRRVGRDVGAREPGPAGDGFEELVASVGVRGALSGDLADHAVGVADLAAGADLATTELPVADRPVATDVERSPSDHQAGSSSVLSRGAGTR